MIIYPMRKGIKTAGIYVIRNFINGKIYVGQTMDAHHRCLAHLSLSRHIKPNSQAIHKAINKYGHENFVFFMLVDDPQISREELNYLEQQTIKMFKERGHRLYNETDGGRAGDLGAEVRKKISNKLKGRVFTEEWTKKISKSLKGKKIPKEQIERAKKTYRQRLEAGCYKNKGPNKKPKIIKYPNKVRIPWNKGLTKDTDERVAKYVNSLNKFYKERKKQNSSKE